MSEVVQRSGELHDYLSAVDWRAPNNEENILIHRANRREELTPGELVIVNIVKSSSHAIDQPRSRLLAFITHEEILGKLEAQISNSYERQTQASDPLQLMRDAEPELYTASMQARKNVAIHQVSAMQGIDLRSLVVR